MTEVLLVRHAQASFDSDDYDQLSPRGHEQSALLGRWLASHDAHEFDHVACGEMRRHRETLQAVREAFEARGRHLPEAVPVPELNEYDHRDVLAAFARHAPHDPDLLASRGGRGGDARAIYRFLRAGLAAWADGRLDGDVIESWTQFRARVARAVARLAEIGGGSSRVLVVTSGGPISQIAAQALELPPSRAVDLNLTIRNSALCEFNLVEQGLKLMSWNSLPHLAAPEHRALWTHF